MIFVTADDVNIQAYNQYVKNPVPIYIDSLTYVQNTVSNQSQTIYMEPHPATIYETCVELFNKPFKIY